MRIKTIKECDFDRDEFINWEKSVIVEHYEHDVENGIYTIKYKSLTPKE